LLQGDFARAATCLGPAEISSEAVVPSHEVVIVVFLNTLREEEIEEFRRQVASFYQSTNRTNPLRMALLTGNNIQWAGPFQSAAQLQEALGEIAPAPPAAAGEAPPPEQFYTTLAAAAPQFGSDWTSVVLAGHFPGVPAETAPFTKAWLSMKLRAARLRVSYWSPAGENAEVLSAVATATGGLPLEDGLKSLAAELRRKTEFHETSWHGPAIPFGFRVCPLSLWVAGDDGPGTVVVPSLIAAAGLSLPDPQHYALLGEKIQSLTATLQGPKLSAGQAAQAEADWNTAMGINPQEEALLRLGVDLFKRQSNDRKLATVLATLTEMEPNDSGLFADLGHARYRLGDTDGADRALARARELKPGDAAVAEELGRIRLAHKDDSGALPFLEESLAARKDNQPLWLIRADVAMRLNDWQRRVDSLEHAVALGTVPLERRTELAHLYLQHQQPDRALVQVRAVAGHLPPDASVRSDIANLLDRLKQTDEALAAWKRTLEADPKLEVAHVRVTQILIEKNDLPEALVASEEGIQAAPRSAPLYLAKADVLAKENRFYDARRTLRGAAVDLSDPVLLEKLAEMEDAGGEHAALY
jgi:tetratricopeptide (TPR) repeat protein